MSNIEELEQTLDALDARIMARIGRWAAAILISVIACTAVSAAHWFNLVNRVDKVETWKLERTKPIEEYYQSQLETSARLERLEATNEVIIQQLKEIKEELRSRR